MRQDELKRPSRVGQALAIVVVVGVVAAIIYPIFAQAKNGKGPTCLSNIKRFGLGLHMYAGDHDDRLPHRDHWMDGALPYLYRDPLALRCDVVAKEGTEGYGYAFNSLLDRRQTASVKDLGTTIALYDSINYGWSASDPVTSLPQPGRHGGSNILCYLDGHVSSRNTSHEAEAE